MTRLHSSSRKQLMLQLLNNCSRAQNPISKGFTLIELLVVVVILGVLGSVGYQQYLAQIGRANGNIAQNTATAIAKNCAALAITDDQGDFSTADFLGNDVTVDNNACDAIGAQQDFTVTVGTGNFQRESTASVTATGAVIPGTDPAAPAPAP